MAKNTSFLYEADHADDIVKNAVESHAKKFNLPIRYGFAGLQYKDSTGYGHIPYIVVDNGFIKVAHYPWHKDKKLAKILFKQPLLTRIDCQ